MVDHYLRRSPLAQLGLVGRAQVTAASEAGVIMSERLFPVIVDLHGDPNGKTFMKAAERTLGFLLPTEPCSTAGSEQIVALWIGPNQWWVVAGADSPMAAKLPTALGKLKAGVTEISDSRTCLRIAGHRARDLIAKGCPLDLHPSVFKAGACAQSLIGKVPITLHQVSDQPVYDLYVLRSMAEFLWLWLEDAAQEYGLAVVSD